MNYLSIDCANKSLAIGFYVLHIDNWKQNLLLILKNKNYSKEEKIKKAHEFLDNIIEIKFLKLIDLIPNKKVKNTSIIERTQSLYKHIEEIKNNIESDIKKKEHINVFIEYQMGPNDKSRGVFNQLIYAFSNTDLYNIKIITPTLKNQIYFTDELKHCRILKRYNSVYTANKVHCKENFLYFLKLFNKEKYINNISKKNIDDVADTFMQMIGQLKLGK